MSGGAHVTIHCRCCDLPQRVPDPGGTPPDLCGVCWGHRGQQVEKQLERATSHEQMLRERMAACRTSESRAQTAKANMQERMLSALRSRSALAARIVGDPKNAGKLAADEKVQAFARRHLNPYADDVDWDDDEHEEGVTFTPARQRGPHPGSYPWEADYRRTLTG